MPNFTHKSANIFTFAANMHFAV